MAQTELDTLLLKISADTAGLRGEMAKANAAVARAMVDIQQSTAKATIELEKLNTAVKAVGNYFGGPLKAAVGAFIAGFGLDAIIDRVKATFDWASATSKLAKELGVSTTALQEMQFVAQKQGGIGSEDFAAGMKKFQIAMDQAAAGLGKGKIAFAALGISIREADGSAKDIFKVLGELSDKIRQFDRPSQVALLKNFFPEEDVARFVNFLAKGKDGWDQLASGARVMKSATVEALAAANKAMKEMTDEHGKAMREVYAEIGLELIAIQRGLEGLIPLIKQAKIESDSWADSIRDILRGYQRIFEERHGVTRPGQPLLADRLTGTGAPAPEATLKPFALGPRSAQEFTRTSGTRTFHAPDKEGLSQLESFRKLMEDLRAETAKLSGKAALDPYAVAIADLDGKLAKLKATTLQNAEAKREFDKAWDQKGNVALTQFAQESEHIAQIAVAELSGRKDLAAQLELEFTLRKQLGDKFVEQNKSQIDSMAKARADLLQNKQIVEEIKSSVEGSISGALVTMTSNLGEFFEKGKNGWQVLGERALGVLQSIAAEMLRIALIQPLAKGAANAIGDWLGPLLKLGSAAAGAFGGISGGVGTDTVPGFASGGSFKVGRSGTDTTPVRFWASPGEEVTVRTPAQIQRGGMSGGGVTYIDARGADSEGLARVEAELRAQRQAIRRVDMSVENRAVGAMVDAKRRGGAAANVFA